MTFLILMFLTRGCLGVSNISDFEGRILEGWHVPIYEYPYSVFLYFQKSSPKCCGSSLITDQAVISAAHCFDELEYHNGKITAYLGATVPQDSFTRRNVILFTIHPRYNQEKGKFNLGIGFFNKPVELSGELQKIPIIRKYPPIDEDVYTVGWGKQRVPKFPKTDYSPSRHLKISKQRILSETDCAEITRQRIGIWCTVSINGYQYHGDAGNGLVSKKKDLIGVVSYMVNGLTVYSDVINQLPWIKDSLVRLFEKFCNDKKDRKHHIHKIV